MDNGPEFISVAMIGWAEQHGVHLEHIQPGKPTQNSFIERFNRTEVLDFYLFSTLTEGKDQTEQWTKEYNEERPHDSLGNMTPTEYLEAHSPCEISTYGWN